MQTACHLLVDGYNILHAWGWVDRSNKSGLLAARHRLVAMVRCIHSLDGCNVTIVFDSPGDEAQLDPGESGDGFSVIHAPRALSADGVIERLVASSGNPSKWMVATTDRLERETVLASGGSCISPDDLRIWIERCGTRSRRERGMPRESFGNKLSL